MARLTIPQKIELGVPLSLTERHKVYGRIQGEILIERHFRDAMHVGAKELLEFARDVILREAGGAAGSLPIDTGALARSYGRDRIHSSRNQLIAYLASDRAYARAIEGNRGNPWPPGSKGRAIRKVVLRIKGRDAGKLTDAMATRIGRSLREQRKRHRA